MKEFRAAARGHEEEYLEFSIPFDDGGDPRIFRVRPATSSQIALLASGLDDGGIGSATAGFQFLKGLLDPSDYRYLRDLIAQGIIGIELLFGGGEDNDTGIVDWIVEKSVARPTKAPTDFLPSQKSGGQRSTGRSRGAGSIPSSSAREAS